MRRRPGSSAEDAVAESGSTPHGSSLHEVMDEAVRQRIDKVLPQRHDLGELDRYYGLLREYPSRRGKFLRGRLTLLSTMAHGASWRDGLTAAAALELFQNWVLLHDDIEDDSDERRGLPTLHRQVGVPVAINAGDGLHAYMWQLLLDDTTLPAGVPAEFLWMIHRTAEGQHLDLSWVEQGRFDVDESEYLEMVRLKTAFYTVVGPLRLGALCAGSEPDVRLDRAGEHLGVAFQIRDDVLNLTPGAAHGKEFAGDLFEGKKTLILAHFFAHASSEQRSEAIERLRDERSGRSEEDVDALLKLLQLHGSVDYAQKVAEERAEEGLSLVRAALQGKADEEAVEGLLDVLQTFTRRQH